MWAGSVDNAGGMADSGPEGQHMETAELVVKLVAALVTVMALPVTAIVRAVNLSRDVKQFNEESRQRDEELEERTMERLKHHEDLCGERMRHLLEGQANILKAIDSLRHHP